MSYTEKTLGTVILKEKPSNDNGYFYVVEGQNVGRQYVSAMGGKAAERGKVGDTFTLNIRSNNWMALYYLTAS